MCTAAHHQGAVPMLAGALMLSHWVDIFLLCFSGRPRWSGSWWWQAATEEVVRMILFLTSGGGATVHSVHMHVHCEDITGNYWLSAWTSDDLISFLSTGNYQKALETYKDIHRKFPENTECNSSCLWLKHQQNAWLAPDDWHPLIKVQRKLKKKLCLSRPAFPGQAVHRHGPEGSPGIRHQAEEGGEDEGDQRTGLSLSALTSRTTFYSVLLPSMASKHNQTLIHPVGSL